MYSTVSNVLVLPGRYIRKKADPERNHKYIGIQINFTPGVKKG
jgi:hypothetical protein